LRLRFSSGTKIKKKVKIAGKDQARVIGIESTVEVYKSSVWKPYHTAPLYIIFDYGIDDIRSNLQYLKTNTKSTVYKIGDLSLGKSLESAIAQVEEDRLEKKLREEVIDLWEFIEDKFKTPRRRKRRPR
jgi:hypothetical protein